LFDSSCKVFKENSIFGCKKWLHVNTIYGILKERMEKKGQFVETGERERKREETIRKRKKVNKDMRVVPHTTEREREGE